MGRSEAGFVASMQSNNDWTEECDILAKAGISIERGLSNDELVRAELVCQFEFPADLRSFLCNCLPVGPKFPNWRQPDDPSIAKQLDWPASGICFDIEHNGFWYPKWGSRPSKLEEAFKIARTSLSSKPRLIPVYAHRYLPANPLESGNPVISVWQTDIIYYGTDIRRYIRCEFGGLDWKSATSGQIRQIDFWTDVIKNREAYCC